MSKYSLDQINIGDDIYYEDKHRTNRSMYWRVIAKMDKSILMIEPADTVDKKEKRMIDFHDVRKFIVLPRK